MKLLLSIILLLLVACSSDDAGGGKNAAAANACDAYAKQQLSGKTYTLDLAALGASLQDQGDGSQFMKAPIVIDPGLTSENKQSLECTVRVAPGKEQPDVIKMQFIW